MQWTVEGEGLKETSFAKEKILKYMQRFFTRMPHREHVVWSRICHSIGVFELYAKQCLEKPGTEDRFLMEIS